MKELAKGYGWPQQGHDAEVESLAWHVQQADGIREDPPQCAEAIRLRETTADWLQVKWEIPDDFDTRAAFERAVERLDWTSSPGLPYCHDNPTNGSLFGVSEGIPSGERMDCMWEIVRQRLEDRTCDPIRLFVKPEPHKLKKIQLKRWRLISSVSVVDQLIDQMLFGEMNDQLVASWFETPLKIGWTPLKGGYRILPRGQVLAIDKSSWDWTVKAWLVEETLEVRLRLASGNRYEAWKKLVVWRYQCLFNRPLFQTSAGVQIRQNFLGVQKSGCVNTITDNSIMQLILHVRVSQELRIPLSWFWALGDDTLQPIPSKVKSYMELLRQFCIVKQAFAKSEFAGFDFSGSTIEPLYRGKHAYNILHADSRYLDDFKRAYKLLYFKSRYYPEVLPFLSGVKASDSAARQIWEG